MSQICQQTKKKLNEKPIINMTNWMKSQMGNLCNFVLAPVTVTWVVIAKKLQSVNETGSLLYNRMMDNTRYGGER